MTFHTDVAKFLHSNSVGIPSTPIYFRGDVNLRSLPDKL